MARRALTMCGILWLAACGGGGGGGSADAPTGADAPSPDAGLVGFTELIGRDWAIDPGQTDVYKCVRVTVPEDVYIQQFAVAAPLGTHHTVLTISSGGADGEYDCNAGSLDYQMLFASGVGTDTLAFPDGVAIKVAAGSHLNLNLHLFDATDAVLSGHTAILVKAIPAAQVQQQAEMVFAGTFDIDVPSDGQPHTAQGGCTLPASSKVVALWPHMHQTATHQQVVYTPVGGSPVTVLDDDYAFSEQRNYPQAAPIDMAAGARLDVTCTYVNDTGTGKTFGESSNSEMCFTGIYRYPATGAGLFQCTTGNPAL